MKLNVSVFLDGEPFPLEDIAFSLDRAEPERTAAFAPEGDGAIGERVRIRARKYDRDEGAGLSDHRL